MRAWGFLIIATIFEVCGDAALRMGIYKHVNIGRIGFFVAGGALLFCYGLFLNLAPFEFGEVVGLYIVTLFVVWQIIAFFAFKTLPTVPILVGGSLVILGGLIITFWKPGSA